MSGSVARVRALGVATVLTICIVCPTQAPAAQKYKQPSCGSFQKQVNKSSGAKKRVAKRNLKQCKANATVYKQVRDSRFVGTRSDGVEIDTQFCANGKWQDDVADDGKVGTNGWRVIDAKVRKGGSGFTAVIEAWIPGGRHVQGVIRDGTAWQIGYEWNGEVKSPGDVEKTDAKAACAAL